MNLTLLRLAVLGSRIGWGRHAAIAAGVALGVAALLLVCGASEALGQRDARTAWLLAGGTPLAELSSEDPVPTRDTAVVAQVADFFGVDAITRLDVAATVDSTLRIPGLDALPGVGEYVASPALHALIDRTPAGQLGERYGTRVASLPDSLLAGPDALVVIVGTSADAVSTQATARLVTGFDSRPREDPASYRILIVIGAFAIVFPVVLLVGIVTQLGAAQRAERYGTLRLIGATPGLVTTIAALEMAVVSLVGALLGVLLAIAIRPVAAQISLNGTFFPDDLAVGPVVVAVIVLLVVSVTAAEAARRTARAGIGPLGVTRQRRERIPSAWRAAPVVIGLGMLTLMTVMVRWLGVSADDVQVLLVAGFAATAAGIIILGPWLTRALSSFIAARTTSAEGVIAASRIRSAPVATFRSVSGLVIAAFIVSVFAGAASAISQLNAVDQVPGLLPTHTLAAPISPASPAFGAGSAHGEAAAIRAAIGPASGIEHLIIGYQPLPEAGLAPDSVVVAAEDLPALGFGPQVERGYAAFDLGRFLSLDAARRATLDPIAGSDIARMAPVVLFATTDGSTAGLESARTAVQLSGITARGPVTRAEGPQLGPAQVLRQLTALAYVGMVVSIVIAGVSHAVATVVATLDRKRPFGLLRLMGMPAASLRRIVVAEAATPLIAVLACSIVVGFLVAGLIVATLADNLLLSWPDPGYFIALGLGLAFALGVAGSTLGMIRSNTGVSATRFE